MTLMTPKYMYTGVILMTMFKNNTLGFPGQSAYLMKNAASY